MRLPDRDLGPKWGEVPPILSQLRLPISPSGPVFRRFQATGIRTQSTVTEIGDPTEIKVARGLLRRSVSNVVAIESEFRRTGFSAADHGLKAMKLAACNQPKRSAIRTGQHGHEGVVPVPQRIRPFQQKDRTGFHSLGNPSFQELQLSCHSALHWVVSTGSRPNGEPQPRVVRSTCYEFRGRRPVRPGNDMVPVFPL